MKYSCEFIRDTLPLYHDHLTSEESNQAVKEHLAECSECRSYYEQKSSSDFAENATYDKQRQQEKAEPFGRQEREFLKL